MSEVIIYQNEQSQTQVSVRLDGETVWLTQRQMAELFDTSADNISLHLKNVFSEGELGEPATTEDLSVVQTEGQRTVTRTVKHYNLDVNFRELQSRVRPKDYIAELRSLLPKKYSPLRPNGDGLQSVYLAEVDRPFAAALYRLIGAEAQQVADVANAVGTAERVSPALEPTLEEWERREPSPLPSPASGRGNARLDGENGFLLTPTPGTRDLSLVV